MAAHKSSARPFEAMPSTLAIGGAPAVRNTPLPYGRQTISRDDIDAVVTCLRSDWLTTGPVVAEFEKAVSQFTGARYGVAMSSGTAALHAIMATLGIEPGDEVIVPPLTFAATANVILYQGGRPVFADVCPDTLLIDPEQVRRKINRRTRAIIGVDFAGQPCDYDALRDLAQDQGIALIADACHSLGSAVKGKKVGVLADLTALSFHPVKHITTAEGGMVLTDRLEYVERLRRFRNHGISMSAREREKLNTWHYEMVELGFNYRLSDLQCALGLSQLGRLPQWLERRQAIANRYNTAFSALDAIFPLRVMPGAQHAFHLYVVRIQPEKLRVNRDTFIQALRAEGIGANVHYLPVYLHPYYQQTLGTGPGLCPVAETAFDHIITLPLFPGMTDQDVTDVITSVTKVAEAYHA